MDRVSVAIITCNEERNIRECLASVSWANDIVVVDNGSTDRTLEICAEFHARIFVEEWKGYARQKNSAIEKTRNEWVLSLDADERVTPELRQEIQRLPEKGGSPVGYFIPRKNFFLGRWIRRCGWYPDYNLRLFQKSKGGFLERAVHERVAVKGRTGTLQSPLVHETYRSLSDYLQRMDRYSTLAAVEMYHQQRKFHLVDLIFRPPFTFFQMYLLRAGFLEGYKGWILSVLYAFYTFTKYIKLKEMADTQQLSKNKYAIL